MNNQYISSLFFFLNINKYLKKISIKIIMSNYIKKYKKINNYNNILKLSDDLVYYIFSFLNIKELYRLEYINKDYKRVLNNNYIWHKYLDKYNIKLKNNLLKYKYINFNFLIKNQILNIRKEIQKVKRKKTKEIMYLVNNISKYNNIINNLLIKKETNKKVNIKAINKYINILKPYVNYKILSSEIYIETLDNYNKLF